MRYIISRTSIWDEEKPCDEAVLKELTFTDERTVDDPIKCNEKTWFTNPKYFNHRVENGHIKRDYKEMSWIIEIKNLKELMEFIEKYNEDLVIGKSWNCKDVPFEIEIYDTYKE